MTDNMPQDAPWWARWLAAEWRDAWRWLSTWLIAAAAVAPMAYENLSVLQNNLPPNIFHWIETGIVCLIFFQNIRRKPNGNNSPTKGQP